MLSKLHDDTERSSFAGASSQKLDHVGMVNLLQEGVLRQQVVQLLPRVIGLEHFHRDSAVTWKAFKPRVTTSYLVVSFLNKPSMICGLRHSPQT